MQTPNYNFSVKTFYTLKARDKNCADFSIFLLSSLSREITVVCVLTHQFHVDKRGISTLPSNMLNEFHLMASFDTH